MLGVERDGENNLRGLRVECIAVAQQHTEQKTPQTNIYGALIIDNVRAINLPTWP